MMHFPPVSDFHPYFRKILRLCGKFTKFYLFPKKFPIFIRQNFWWPALTNFPPVFGKFISVLHALRVIFFPLLWPWCIYASPNARTGRPWSGVQITFWSRGGYLRGGRLFHHFLGAYAIFSPSWQILGGAIAPVAPRDLHPCRLLVIADDRSYNTDFAVIPFETFTSVGYACRSGLHATFICISKKNIKALMFSSWLIACSHLLTTQSHTTQKAQTGQRDNINGTKVLCCWC